PHRVDPHWLGCGRVRPRGRWCRRGRVNRSGCRPAFDDVVVEKRTYLGWSRRPLRVGQAVLAGATRLNGAPPDDRKRGASVTVLRRATPATTDGHRGLPWRRSCARPIHVRLTEMSPEGASASSGPIGWAEMPPARAEARVRTWPSVVLPLLAASVVVVVLFLHGRTIAAGVLL